MIFQSGHILIFPAVYISFTGLVQILAGHMKISAGHVNFQNHVPDGHVNQMLNVKPCEVPINCNDVLPNGTEPFILTNVEQSSVRSCSVAFSLRKFTGRSQHAQDINPWSDYMSLKINILRSQPYFPEANELIINSCYSRLSCFRLQHRKKKLRQTFTCRNSLRER